MQFAACANVIVLDVQGINSSKLQKSLVLSRSMMLACPFKHLFKRILPTLH